VVQGRQLEAEPDSAEYLRKLCLREGRTELARLLSRADICNILNSIGRYEGRPPIMTKAEMERGGGAVFRQGVKEGDRSQESGVRITNVAF